jgi:cell division protease FtsH
VFLGREISEQRDYSDKIAQDIDEEVHSLVDNAYQAAKRVLTEHKDKLASLARYLIANETVEGDALRELLDTSPSLPDAAPA